MDQLKREIRWREHCATQHRHSEKCKWYANVCWLDSQSQTTDELNQIRLQVCQRLPLIKDVIGIVKSYIGGDFIRLCTGTVLEIVCAKKCQFGNCDICYDRPFRMQIASTRHRKTLLASTGYQYRVFEPPIYTEDQMHWLQSLKENRSIWLNSGTVKHTKSRFLAIDYMLHLVYLQKTCNGKFTAIPIDEFLNTLQFPPDKDILREKFKKKLR